MNEDINPLYADVFPGGVLGRMLRAIANPRRHRWKAYLRACKRIPKDSPVHGSTSFQKINARRHEIIDRFFAAKREDELKEDAEYQAVRRATSEWLCGPTVAVNFLLGRKLRRLRELYPDLE